MKYLSIYILLFAFTVSSCKKSFIELAPEDQNNTATFYQTEIQFKEAVYAAYIPLRGLLDNDYYMGESRSDNTHYEFVPTIVSAAYLDRENIADFTDKATNAYTNDAYFQCYSGIARTNLVIEKVPASSVAAAVKTDIDGQAKFLRAYYYFKLVRYFGGVPLVIKTATKTEEFFVPRSSADTIYNQIISDASDAIKELAVPAKFPQTGLATKGSATMLLAEVYMTQKKYAEAEALLNTLPAMGYGLNTNYADAFLPTNKNSKESLFEIQYLEGTAAGTQPSNFIYVFLPRSTNTSLITGVVTNNSGTGGWNTPTKDLISTYELNDKRLDASIGIAEGTYNTSSFLVISANKSVVNYTPAAGKVGVPYIKKYVHAPYATANNTGENWPIYRYSDALLLLAEALNEQGKSPLTPLNAVRTRAGLTGSTATSQAVLRDVIAHERRVELAFENHRWHDLVRTGKAIEVMTAYGVKQKALYSYLSSDSYNVTTNRLLYPIPQSEVDLNPKVLQNPGY